MALTIDLTVKEQSYIDRTYKMSDTQIAGFVDGMEALKQSIYKALSTEQYEYPIYSFQYGIAWKQLIGEDRSYVRAELRRMVEELLMRDDRIQSVDGFEFSFSGDSCHCSFDVSSIYGDIRVTTEGKI
jgi:hypothetical protein|nr:MAG TPA: Protein of unknown function (DUF2634) [Caudoviricetes sp.]